MARFSKKTVDKGSKSGSTKGKGLPKWATEDVPGVEWKVLDKGDVDRVESAARAIEADEDGIKLMGYLLRALKSIPVRDEDGGKGYVAGLLWDQAGVGKALGLVTDTGERAEKERKRRDGTVIGTYMAPVYDWSDWNVVTNAMLDVWALRKVGRALAYNNGTPAPRDRGQGRAIGEALAAALKG